MKERAFHSSSPFLRTQLLGYLLQALQADDENHDLGLVSYTILQLRMIY